MSKEKLNKKILSKVHYSEYWKKPCAFWGNTQIWDNFFTERNQNATKLVSRYFRNEPGTKKIEKAYAIQEVSIHE
ncbi:12802_t:CDS:2 [Funneliformis mosseae]|uniref:12802_t:CDS:1 n=1 Tax=Funneliformis mosseae TaxID=27381 RepID=A0A9N9FYB7_FUNMO|nr:12802_t:CDS:2 [Funneliformis mosseae]